MDYRYYQRKINDVIEKCPIEAGVEILVYTLLDQLIDSEKYSLVDINRIWKNQDTRLVTGAGIPDIAVLSKDFLFKNEDAGVVYGFIEVKAAGVGLRNTEQISGELSSINHFIYTNGIVWKYYENHEETWVVNLLVDERPYSEEKVEISKEKYDDLIEKIRQIGWCF